MNRQSRTKVALALRAAAEVLAAPPADTPRPLKQLLDMLSRKYPKTKFTLDGFARPQMDTSYWIRSSDFRGDVLRVSKWTLPNGSESFDVFIAADENSSPVRVIHDAKKLPTFVALAKLIERIKVQIGQLPDDLPRDPAITSVKVSPYTVDEWVGYTISVAGAWKVYTQHYDMTPEHEEFARRVFEKALPQIRQEVAKLSTKKAQVWEHGSWSPGDPLTEKAYPSVRGYSDVGQVDFDGETITFDVSDR